MSCGHQHCRHDDINAKEAKQLELLLADKKFQDAVGKYLNEDERHDVAYLAGSSTDGQTIFFDRDFSSAINSGKIKYRGKAFDPRPYLRVHEAVEGAILRKQFTRGVWMLKQDPSEYETAHRIAIIAEKLAVAESLGHEEWKAYDAPLHSYIKPDTPQAVPNPPKGILRAPDQAGAHQGFGTEEANNTDMIVIRHGATALNERADSPDMIRGWQDVPLDAHGKQEAKQIAQQLKDSGIEVIYSSDLQRASVTANEISKATGAPVVLSMELRPWNLGELTGKHTKEVLPKVAEYANNPDRCVPEGESFNDFKKRAFHGIFEAMRQTPDQALAIVTHHRVERLLNAWENKGQPADLSLDLKEFLQKGEKPGSAQVFVFKRAPISVTDSVARGKDGGSEGE